MAATLISAVCIVQIALLLAFTARGLMSRRRQIVTALRHTGWLDSARGLLPMQREPAFGGNAGAIVYLLPERCDGFRTSPQQYAA